jgi:hypothetical protein
MQEKLGACSIYMRMWRDLSNVVLTIRCMIEVASGSNATLAIMACAVVEDHLMAR